MRLGSSLLLGSVGWASALTQQCSGVSVNESGNYFCGSVGHILYEGLGGKGKYDAVAAMDLGGNCDFVSKTYSGPLAPLDEGLSIHIRGPFQLRKAAVYTFSPERKRSVAISRRAHGHRHWHRRAHRVQKRADMVTATINGVVVSWVNNYFGPGVQQPPPPAPVLPTPPPVVPSSRVPSNAVPPLAVPFEAARPHELPPSAQSPQSHRLAASANRQPVVTVTSYYTLPGPHGEETHPPAPPPSQPFSVDQETPQADAETQEAPHAHQASDSSGGSWDRIAYYDATSQAVENMMFMGNYGGQGSGVFDTRWGNSLAYLNADGSGGSASPETLKDVLLPSNKEFSIFSAEKCDESCGFSRARDVAYKGFAGANKVFLFRFNMPHDKAEGFNGDMPALWLLNARIPRTGQYHSCSCWGTKCGEADIFEVLAPGDTKCKSTFHVATSQKERPVSIKVLPSDTDFSQGLDDETVESWVRDTHDTEKSSLFQVAG
ncbi:TOS1 protein [Ophiocordyceps sinensis CO18]|uniref:glucan endo-1,3-beta-D-glucosidase n=1 Tax=Ophiocordyceps sinensis (strain Co18 / CGMCC 3.14243) TaxID=911162 RepID=T5AJ24_OPHSC|nr:TOS1 protein [Ophiocordyceps sinensis CO18]